MIWIAIGAGVVIVLAVVLMAMKKRKRKNFAGANVYRSLLNPSAAAPGPVKEKNAELEALRQNLRLKLMYQEDKVDAAIELERERNPSGTRQEHLKAAIARWERDNQ